MSSKDLAIPDWQGLAYVLAYDIVGYTQRDHATQLRAVELTKRVRHESVRKLQDTKAIWVDAGDGGYLLLRDDVRLPLQALEHFLAHIRQENQVAREEFQVELRYILHEGDVHVKGEGEERTVTGDAINVCARILAGMDRANAGQVLASGRYRDHVVKLSPENADFFTRLPDIIDKHGIRHIIWNVYRQPGFGISVPSPPRAAISLTSELHSRVTKGLASADKRSAYSWNLSKSFFLSVGLTLVAIVFAMLAWQRLATGPVDNVSQKPKTPMVRELKAAKDVDRLEVMNELRAKGLITKLEDAHNYVNGGGRNGFELGVKLYRDVIDQLSQGARKKLNQEWLAAAAHEHQEGSIDLAAHKYQALFADYVGFVVRKE